MQFMTPSTQPLDIATLAIAAFTALFGAQIGVPLGVYAVIIIGAFGGACWSASKLPERGRGATLLHIAWMVGLALIGTVPIAEAVARWMNLNERWMFAPVAVVIAARPDWVVAQVRRFYRSRMPDASKSASEGEPK
jgi:hypothetical protein